MACEKHGYTNNTLCPACDLETIEKYSKPVQTAEIIPWDGKKKENQCSFCKLPESKCDNLIANKTGTRYVCGKCISKFKAMINPPKPDPDRIMPEV